MAALHKSFLTLIASLLLLALCMVLPLSAWADDSKNVTAPLTTAPKSTVDSPNKDLPEGVYVITSALRGNASLDVAGASNKNGAKVQIYSDNSTPAQRWRLEPVDGGFYRIVNVGSGKVLDVASGKMKPGTKVQQYAWNGTPAQKWKISSTSGGYVITSALSKNLVLDVRTGKKSDGTQVQIYSANGTKAQVWSLKAINPVLSNGVYTFANVGSGKLLDEASGNVNSGTNVHQYSSNGSIAQFFAVQYDKKTGYYTVYAVNSGMALDVANGSEKNGANVQLYMPNGTLAQKWAVVKSGSAYVLLNAVSGKALDITKGSTKNGANVQIFTSNGTNAQKFRASAVTNWLPDGIYNFVTSNNQGLSLNVSKAAMKAGSNIESAGRIAMAWEQNWLIQQDKGSPGYYTIRNMNSRMALSVKSNNASSGANVQQEALKAGSAGQLWRPIHTPGGVIWQSKLSGDFVLDLVKGGKVSGTNAQIYARNNTIAQKFRMKNEDLTDLLKSTAFVIRNVESNKVLDVSNGSLSNGALIQLYESNGTGAQKFRLSANGSGMHIVNANSSKAIDIDSAGKTKIQQWSKGNAVNQRFVVSFDTKSMTFTVKSTFTGKMFDGTGGKLSQQAASGKDAQKWILQPTEADYFRVYLNAGHGWNDYNNGAWASGATANGYQEANLTYELCGMIIKIARDQYGLDVVDGRDYRLAYWNRLPKAVSTGCSTIFSVHFDAGGGSGPMTMVGVDGRHPASLTFANIMSRHLNASLPALAPRRMSYRNDITCVNGSIPAVLVEVCFVDNSRDINYYQNRKNTVAKELAAGLYEASQQKSLRKNR